MLHTSMSSDSRASKRRRQGVVDNVSGEDEPPLDLLALYQSDIGDRLFSFATGADLCTLDILNKQFKRLTTEPWKRITKERFGMNNGKEGWRKGTSFLRPPVFIHLTDMNPDSATGFTGCGYGYYPGSPRVAANESIIVAVTDDANGLGYHPNNEMGTRYTYNLNYIESLPSPIRNWRVSICGREGSEIIVTSNSHQMCARQNNDMQNWQYNVNIGNGVPSIGSETHLIIATNGRINIFEVNLDGRREDGIAELLLLRQSITADSNVGRYDTPSIAWSPDKRHFIVCFNQIYVYKFDKDTNSATLVKTIDVGDFAVANVALAEEYIVACSDDRKVHIWNRSSGDKMAYTTRDALEELDYLCDDVELDLDEDEVDEVLETTSHPLHFSCHGHILVSTSLIGCALCIWNMKTGQLLGRYNDVEDEQYTTLLPQGNDATDMVYLKHLNAFLCMEGFMNIWSFPTNKRQYDMAISTRRREEMLRRAIYEEDD